MLERPGSQVWGVLWELDTEHSETLDQQEGVPTVYNKKTVNVMLEDGSAQVGLPGLSLQAGLCCQKIVNVAAVKLVKIGLKYLPQIFPPFPRGPTYT